MHRNHLLFSLLGLFAVACALPNDRRPFVRVITEPKPGEEYVSIHTGMPSSALHSKPLESDMDVKILDEGQTGIKEVAGSVPMEEKIYAHKKLYPSNEDGQRRSKAEKKYAAPIDTDISHDAKPNKLKIKREEETSSQSFSKGQEITRNNNNNEDDGLFDFVDSPYGNQKLVGSASSQASRVNIKKAPNGQEYEYEYVYYYYDEDEEHAKPGSKNSQSTSNSPPTSSKPNKDVKENSKSKRPAVVQDENQFVQNTNKGRFSAVEHTVTTEEPEGHANFAVNDIAEHNSKTKESGRNLEEALSVPSSSLPVSEERLPHNARFPVRSRGNSKPAQEIATTAVPSTDTPITRIRANNNGPHQPGLDLVDSNAFRTHSSNGQHAQATSPRHESHRDAVVQTTAMPADQVATINNAYNTQLTETVASVTEPVSLDRNQDNTDVDTKGLSLTTALTPDEVVTVVTQRYTPGSTDKGAVDLYAILQQTRSEETANTILSSEHSTRFEDSETQYPTTLRLAPTTTTTTTTTTQAPTTTTTTTTTTQAPPPARQAPGSGPVRSRYRGGSGGSRNTLTSTTTTTTELPPSEEVTEKRKFKPTRERNTQASVYSKRYQSSTAALDKESTTAESEVVTRAQKPSFGGRQRTRASKPVTASTVQIDENVEVTSAAPKSNFAERSNLRRQNSRNKFTTSASTTTTAAPVQQVTEDNESNGSEHEVSEPTTTTARAIGGRLRPNIRPLRPGLRLNFGGKGSSTTAAPVQSTTQVPIVESSPDEVEEKELVQETSPTPAPDSLSRLKNKSRFRVPEKQGPLAPKQQTLAPPATGQNRKHLLSNLLPKKKSIQTEEPPVLEDVKPVLENEQESDQGAELQNEEDIDRQQPSSTTTSTTEAPPSSTNKLSSLLKRRPLQRRPALDLPSRQSNQDE